MQQQSSVQQGRILATITPPMDVDEVRIKLKRYFTGLTLLNGLITFGHLTREALGKKSFRQCLLVEMAKGYEIVVVLDDEAEAEQFQETLERKTGHLIHGSRVTMKAEYEQPKAATR